eukprot:CAMPEP_0114581462 /NCGR_PEP_ID=MMETSP0125-20121206/5569_1 /TAXON_ID=485358 ORGANISM="Aristerostoma sp., Strain ATCC 50986" /NCGR_SAMPLE_ID=MMETSP0125 /ASSEMBLY_ACC=CAM_ASM_000245 /LENGTH=143 /DNA_ID=CAMNT_0001773691 /DNA_START=205 /DNA_END=636 /DNA_ORIENTATION=-
MEESQDSSNGRLEMDIQPLKVEKATKSLSRDRDKGAVKSKFSEMEPNNATEEKEDSVDHSMNDTQITTTAFLASNNQSRLIERNDHPGLKLIRIDSPSKDQNPMLDIDSDEQCSPTIQVLKRGGNPAHFLREIEKQDSNDTQY